MITEVTPSFSTISNTSLIASASPSTISFETSEAQALKFKELR
jgi:hypothetical protein